MLREDPQRLNQGSRTILHHERKRRLVCRCIARHQFRAPDEIEPSEVGRIIFDPGSQYRSAILLGPPAGWLSPPTSDRPDSTTCFTLPAVS